MCTSEYIHITFLRSFTPPRPPAQNQGRNRDCSGQHAVALPDDETALGAVAEVLAALAELNDTGVIVMQRQSDIVTIGFCEFVRVLTYS